MSPLYSLHLRAELKVITVESVAVSLTIPPPSLGAAAMGDLKAISLGLLPSPPSERVALRLRLSPAEATAESSHSHSGESRPPAADSRVPGVRLSLSVDPATSRVRATVRAADSLHRHPAASQRSVTAASSAEAGDVAVLELPLSCGPGRHHDVSSETYHALHDD